MSDTAATWSPADNLYSVAASEAQMWLRCVVLTSRRIHESDDKRSPGLDSRQLDARLFVVALSQLLIAHNLERMALQELGMDERVIKKLDRAKYNTRNIYPESGKCVTLSYISTIGPAAR